MDFARLHKSCNTYSISVAIDSVETEYTDTYQNLSSPRQSNTTTMSSNSQEMPLFDDVLSGLIPGFEERENGVGAGGGSDETLFDELDDLNMFQELRDPEQSNSVLTFDVNAETKVKNSSHNNFLKKVAVLNMNNFNQNDQDLVQLLCNNGMVVKDSVTKKAEAQPSRSVEQIHVSQPVLKVGGDISPPLPSPTQSVSSDPDYEPTCTGLSYKSRFGSKSMSKHAILARENRQKKKTYVQGLEQSVASLKSENKHLKTEMSDMEKSIKTLESEVAYLKSVIANQSTLSSLLKNIDATPGIELSTSLAPTKPSRCSETKVKSGKKGVKRPSSRSDSTGSEKENSATTVVSIPVVKKGKLDHDYASSGSIIPPEAEIDEDDDDQTPTAGVCLHVSNKKVRLEFCAQCSNNAASAQRSSAYNLRAK